MQINAVYSLVVIICVCIIEYWILIGRNFCGTLFWRKETKHGMYIGLSIDNRKHKLITKHPYVILWAREMPPNDIPKRKPASVTAEKLNEIYERMNKLSVDSKEYERWAKKADELETELEEALEEGESE